MTLFPTRKPALVYWVGAAPVRCDHCDQPLTGEKFVDGRVKITDTWGILSLGCHRRIGAGLGIGNGQLYAKQADGRYLKTEG